MICSSVNLLPRMRSSCFPPEGLQLSMDRFSGSRSGESWQDMDLVFGNELGRPVEYCRGPLMHLKTDNCETSWVVCQPYFNRNRISGSDCNVEWDSNSHQQGNVVVILQSNTTDCGSVDDDDKWGRRSLVRLRLD